MFKRLCKLLKTFFQYILDKEKNNRYSLRTESRLKSNSFIYMFRPPYMNLAAISFKWIGILFRNKTD